MDRNFLGPCFRFELLEYNEWNARCEQQKWTTKSEQQIVICDLLVWPQWPRWDDMLSVCFFLSLI